MNSLSFNGLALMDGNLKCDASGGGQETTGTMMPETGKWYYEFLLQTFDGGNEQFGITRTTAVIGSTYLQGVNYRTDGDKFVDGTSSAYGATWTTGDIISIAVDRDADTIQFYKNGSGQGTIDISSLLVKLKNFDDTKSPLTNFFSRNGQFFNSNLNKRLRCYYH